MKTPGILILTRRDVSELLSLKEAIVAVEEAFRMHAENQALTPDLLHVDSQDGEFHIKVGGLKQEKTYFGLKANAGFFQNMQRYGLPNIQGVILLFDGDKGSPLALMDSIDITILRTGAATAVAAKYLARLDSRTATICGCGKQGQIQLRSLQQVLPNLERVFAFDVDQHQVSLYTSKMSSELGIAVTQAETLENSASRSDVIVTCTPSQKHFLEKAHVRPGTFIAAIGADSPDKQELEPDLLVGNKVVVDILDQCARVGELHHALDAGLVTQQDVYGELGDIIGGNIPGRTSGGEITIFDATGTALQDVAAAVVVYEKALNQKVGTLVDLYA